MSHPVLTPSSADDAILQPQQSTTNFFYSFSFLPKVEREAMHSVYAFCRHTDDIVDEDLPLALRSSSSMQHQDVVERKREMLYNWRLEVDKCYNGTSKNHILRRLTPVVLRFAIPKQYLHTLIDGCEKDLVNTRYNTFEDLKEYCYGVASIVGLITIEIFGYKHDSAKEYAVNLGYALQLTNILRDIQADGERGRIYLPTEDLHKFKYSEDDIFSRRYNENFTALMEYEVRRAREYYHKARAALAPEDSASMFAPQVMDAIYYRLLEKIELENYDIYSRRISVSSMHKILIAMRLWLKTRFLQQRT